MSCCCCHVLLWLLLLLLAAVVRPGAAQLPVLLTTQSRWTPPASKNHSIDHHVQHQFLRLLGLSV
jgi:hypothetical protein